ncbi:MAG: hypothetical protein R3250_14470, partial [Melioribacteraceae bacterium]|nr:hypothetical protein [Melioribacteraceae bacterium]
MKLLQIFETNLLFIFLYIFLMPSVHLTQNSVPTHQAYGEYIDEWLILGPLFPRSLDKDFFIDKGGESTVKPSENDILVTPDGDTLTWTYHRSNRKIVNLLATVGNFQYSTAYAYCRIYSNSGGKHFILLGSDDGAALWLNGKRIHNNNVDRPLYLDNDMIEVELKKGVNHCLVKVSQGTLNWGLSMRVLPYEKSFSNTPKFYLSKEHIDNSIYISSFQWKYSSGDSEDWADPDFADSSWELVTPTLNAYELNKSNWNGTGWFRLNISVDSFLINKPLGLSIRQAGSSQLYLDGELLYSFDEDSDWTGVPKVLSFNDMENHLIAIRHSNLSFEKFRFAGLSSGFYIRLGYINEMTEERIQREETLVSYQMFFTGLTIAIGLLHLILFLFFPTLRQNFFFALFLFSYAVVIFYDYQHLLAVDLDQHIYFIRMHRAANTIFYLVELSFLYSLFYKKM